MVEHTIETGTAQPIKQAPRRLSPYKRDVVESRLTELIELGRIEPSSSPWSGPIVLAKKRDESYRLCIDYRNSLTVPGGFLVLILSRAFFRVPIAKKDSSKTAFVTHTGYFQRKSMPFGL